MCGSELLFGAGLIGTVILFLCTTARGYPFLIQHTVTYQEKNCYLVIFAASKSAMGVTWIWRYAQIRDQHNKWCYMHAYSNERLGYNRKPLWKNDGDCFSIQATNNQTIYSLLKTYLHKHTWFLKLKKKCLLTSENGTSNTSNLIFLKLRTSFARYYWNELHYVTCDISSLCIKTNVIFFELRAGGNILILG